MLLETRTQKYTLDRKIGLVEIRKTKLNIGTSHLGLVKFTEVQQSVTRLSVES